MNLATKGLISILAGASTATGGSFLTKKIIKDGEIRRYKAQALGELESIEIKFLGNESSPLTKYKDKYAESYLWYLVSSETSNKAWWDWIFKHEYPLIEEEKHGFKVETSDDLKNACQKAYEGTKKEQGEIIVTADNNNQTKYLEVHLWRLCSTVHQKIETISESAGESDKYKPLGEIGETYGNKYKDKLASVYSESLGNQEFWLDREEAYLHYSQLDKKPDPKQLLVKKNCGSIYETRIDEQKEESEKNKITMALFAFCSVKGYE